MIDRKDVVLCYEEYNGDKLRYFLRSVFNYMRFVNNIYVIMKDSDIIPDWLNLDMVCVKKYSDIGYIENDALYGNIEMLIPNIEELSEYFIYFANSAIVTEPCSISDFFAMNKCNITSIISTYHYKETDADKTIMYNNSKIIDDLLNIGRKTLEYEYICKDIIPMKKLHMDIGSYTNIDIRLYSLYLLKTGYSSFNAIHNKKYIKYE